MGVCSPGMPNTRGATREDANERLFCTARTRSSATGRDCASNMSSECTNASFLPYS